MVLVLFVATRCLLRDKAGTTMKRRRLRTFGHRRRLLVAHGGRAAAWSRRLGRPARGQPRPDPGLRLELGRERRQPVGRRRPVRRASRSSTPRRRCPGPAGLRQPDLRLRGDLARLSGLDPVTGADDTSQGRPYAYLPIAAGGTVVPVPDPGSTASRSRTCGSPARRWPRSSPTRSPTGTTRRSPRTTTGTRCRRCRSSRSCSPRARAPPRSSPATSPPSTRASGRRSPGQSGPHRVLPRAGRRRSRRTAPTGP